MSSFSPGASLGPYQVIEPLGAGGMGEVFKARDTRLDRIVALKILPQHLSSSEELRQRFEREARAISKLSHPNVCQLFDIGHESGISYLVMEYLEGETLAQRLAKGPIPLTDTLQYGAQIAEALEAAHREGILHRDMKPGNVVLTKMGAKLLDFGLAKNASLAGSAGDISASPTLTSPLTTEGTIVGTYQYIAPEVLDGRAADKRSDIFGFGAMLYEMITGQKAFHGKTQASVIAAVLEREPARASALTPTTPARLDELVRVCLLKDPDERRQSMHDIALELKAILAGLEDPSDGIAPASPIGGVPVSPAIPVTPPPVAVPLDPSSGAPPDSSSGVHAQSDPGVYPQSGSGLQPQSGSGLHPAEAPPPVKGGAPRVAWAVALLSLAAAGVLGWLYMNEPEPEPPRVIQASIQPPPDYAFDLNGQHPGPPVLSPDGTMVAFTAIDTLGNSILFVRSLAEAEARPLPGTAGAGYPFWSPDGKHVGFFSDGKLRKVDLGGASVLSICEARRGKGGTWHANGTILFSPEHDKSIYRVSSAGGEPVAVTKLDSAKADNSHRFPQFLPDGESFIYFARRDQGDGAILLANLDGANRELMPSLTGAFYADEHLFYLKEGALIAHPFDPGEKEFAGEAVPLVNQVELLRSASYGVISVSNHGELVYLSDTDASLMQLSAYDRAGQRVRALEEKGYYNDFTVSPDGNFIAVNVSDPESGSNDIWVIDLESEVHTRLTFGQEEELSPTWSPDGSEIIYHAFEGTERVLYRKSVLGGSDKVEVHRSESIQLWPTAWHPDSAFVICAASDNNLWLVPLDPERELVQWTDTDYLERSASFSPDGRWLAFSSDETGRLHAYVTAFPEGGRKWQVSGSEEGNAPKFDAQHGQILYYGIKLAKVMRAGYEVSGDDLQILRPEILLDARRSIKSDVTRDGNRIWMIESLEESGGLPMKLVLNWRELLRI